jgi:oxygen-dependent protoporphyrinogen oxidase
MLAFEDGRTLAAYLGALPPRVAALIRALTERNGADPVEMSAGHGLRSFANVWAKTAPGTNLVSGTEALPAALSDRLANRILTGWRVTSATSVPGPGRPAVRLTGETAEGRPLRLVARACILAVPAPVALRLAEGLGAEAERALAGIRYGPFLSLGLTLETAEALPWRDTYAIATPGLPFSVLFNHDRMRPDLGGGGMHSMMLFRGARGAAEEMEASDDEIVGRWIAALEAAFPLVRGRVRGARLMRWPLGAPFAAPGRAALQAGLDAVAPPFALAGDYLEFPNMEAAAQSGVRAAAAVARWL